MAESSRIERLPPQSIEAEEAVLGAMLIDPDAIIRVATILKPEDFYREKNRWIYDTALTLHERREPIDFLTVCDELDRREQLDQVGGPAFITSLINAVPTSVHAEYYANIVEKAATRRRLLEAAGEIAALAYQEADDVDEVVDRAEQVLFGVSERRVARELVPIKQVLSEYYDRIEYLTRHRGEMIGIPTGFHDLDKILGGMQRSDMLILAARPSVGKTSLALSIAHSAAKRFRQRVAFFSLEMSNEQVVQRLISAETGINSQRLRRGEIAEEEWGRFMKAASDLAETHFFIDDTPGASALELRTKARRLHADVGLDLIVVDYLQLMRGDFRSENRVQEISSISRALKALARELNVPLLALSQLSRGVEARSDKRPILSDLRECLTGDAWVVRADIGERATMADLAAEGKPVPVWALDDDLKLKPVWMDRVFASGVKPVFRLRTRSGRTIRASGNHPFLRVDGWARLDRLAAGDAIAVPRTIPQAQQPIDCGRHDARYGEFPAATATTRHIKNPSLRGASVVCERRSNPRLRKGDCFGPNGGPRNDSFLIVAMPGWTPRTMKIRATLAPDHNPALSPGAAGCDPRVAGAVLGVAPFASDCRRSKAVLGCEEEIASAQTTGLAMTEGKILACSDVYWDQIESIEPDGEEAVYDGTVPGLHNFVANDMIVHNSGALEQDADVVIFIYRDELYNENTERKNIADILVAKHRNGPTGSVALYFKKELAQFLEAEVRRQEINF